MQTPKLSPSKKLTPILYSPKHSSSLKKSKALERLVEVFLQENFEKSQYQIPSQNDMSLGNSNDSITNEKKFMESEVQILQAVIGDLKEYHLKKDEEIGRLKKEMKGLNEKQHRKEHYKRQALELKEKLREIEGQIEREKDYQKQQRDRLVRDYEEKLYRLNNTLRNYQKEVEGVEEKQKQWSEERTHYQRINQEQRKKFEKMIEHLQMENQRYERQIDKLSNENITAKAFQMHFKSLEQRNQQMSRNFDEAFLDVKRLAMENEKIRMAQDLSNTEKRALERRYHELEDIHGKTITSYEIKLQNLRDALYSIKKNWSTPKKSLYQISNRSRGSPGSVEGSPVGNSESIGKGEDSARSNISGAGNGAANNIRNYKQENEYLREYLTELLDKNADLKTHVRKMEIIVAASSKKSGGNEPGSSIDRSPGARLQPHNVDSDKDFSEAQLTDRSFKKKKKSHLLIVSTANKDSSEDVSVTIEEQISEIFRNVKQVPQRLNCAEKIKWMIEQWQREREKNKGKLTDGFGSVKMTSNKSLNELDVKKEDIVGRDECCQTELSGIFSNNKAANSSEIFRQIEIRENNPDGKFGIEGVEGFTVSGNSSTKEVVRAGTTVQTVEKDGGCSPSSLSNVDVARDYMRTFETFKEKLGEFYHSVMNEIEKFKEEQSLKEIIDVDVDDDVGTDGRVGDRKVAIRSHISIDNRRGALTGTRKSPLRQLEVVADVGVQHSSQSSSEMKYIKENINRDDDAKVADGELQSESERSHSDRRSLSMTGGATDEGMDSLSEIVARNVSHFQNYSNELFNRLLKDHQSHNQGQSQNQSQISDFSTVKSEQEESLHEMTVPYGRYHCQKDEHCENRSETGPCVDQYSEQKEQFSGFGQVFDDIVNRGSSQRQQRLSDKGHMLKVQYKDEEEAYDQQLYEEMIGLNAERNLFIREELSYFIASSSTNKSKGVDDGNGRYETTATTGEKKEKEKRGSTLEDLKLDISMFETELERQNEIKFR